MRGKYAINAPFESVIQPYIGLKMITVNAPQIEAASINVSAPPEKKVNETEAEKVAREKLEKEYKAAQSSTAQEVARQKTTATNLCRPIRKI